MPRFGGALPQIFYRRENLKTVISNGRFDIPSTKSGRNLSQLWTKIELVSQPGYRNRKEFVHQA